EGSDGESFIACDSLSFMGERRIDPLRGPRWQSRNLKKPLATWL
ncbi:MAG: hypothetical protein RIS70_1349, partial [Planctomycetota bacterium]